MVEEKGGGLEEETVERERERKMQIEEPNGYWHTAMASPLTRLTRSSRSISGSRDISRVFHRRRRFIIGWILGSMHPVVVN